QIHVAVIVADVDVADVATLDAGFVGDGADDVSGQHALRVSDLDAIGLRGLAAIDARWRAGLRFRLGGQQQRRLSLHHAGERRGDFDGGNIRVRLDLFEQRLEVPAG